VHQEDRRTIRVAQALNRDHAPVSSLNLLHEAALPATHLTPTLLFCLLISSWELRGIRQYAPQQYPPMRRPGEQRVT
jgi:hypothetical protein